MKGKTIDTVFTVVHDTVRVTDTSNTYTEIKKGIIDGLEDAETKKTGSGESALDVVVPIALFSMIAYLVGKGIEAKRVTRIAMIDKGMDPSFLDGKPAESTKVLTSLRTGLFLAGIGTGLLAGYALGPSAGGESDLFLSAGGLIGGGIGFILYHFLVRGKEK